MPATHTAGETPENQRVFYTRAVESPSTLDCHLAGLRRLDQSILGRAVAQQVVQVAEKLVEATFVRMMMEFVSFCSAEHSWKDSVCAPR
mmetsp:Transcript_36775/g.106070  ORF Transcript_36775/g.106070 Transcript_36775/m.106070 type:complete len:89 (+) Transcript_36775:140-406(+)